MEKKNLPLEQHFPRAGAFVEVGKLAQGLVTSIARHPRCTRQKTPKWKLDERIKNKPENREIKDLPKWSMLLRRKVGNLINGLDGFPHYCI